MTKDNIVTLPEPSLRHRSQRVGVITPEIRQLCLDMIEAARDWEASRNQEICVGLAGVQVGHLIRVVIIRNDFNDHKNRDFTVFINPEIVKHEGEVITEPEGCLSVPDIYGEVPRHSKVRVTALDIDGRPFRITAEGFLARILQHEIDHLHGKLFIDHIEDDKQAFYRLMPDGKLEPLDYDKAIKHNDVLWS